MNDPIAPLLTRDEDTRLRAEDFDADHGTDICQQALAAIDKAQDPDGCGRWRYSYWNCLPGGEDQAREMGAEAYEAYVVTLETAVDEAIEQWNDGMREHHYVELRRDFQAAAEF